MKTKVLIAYTKDPNEIFNRKSALGSYIYCLSELLSDECEIYLNGVQLEDLNQKQQANQSVNPSAMGKITRFIPKWFKAYIREKKLMRNAQVLTQQILDSGIHYDCVIEFLTLGSSLSTILKEKQNVKQLIVYDAPLIEEYKFFQGVNPFFKNKLKASISNSLRSADGIVVYSNPMKDHISEQFGLNRNIIHISQNIDFTRFGYHPESKFYSDPIKICFIGSFLKWHNVQGLVSVFDEILNETELDLELFLAGDGMERKASESFAKTLSHKDKIHFLGFLDGTELENLKKEMHIGIMPGSNWYGAPNKLFEYGAMRLACIAPATPTITDIFKREEVILFEMGSDAELKKALITLCSSNNQMEKYACRLYDFIREKYSDHKTRDFYLDLINN